MSGKFYTLTYADNGDALDLLLLLNACEIAGEISRRLEVRKMIK